MFLWRTTATATKRRSAQTITMIEEIILQSLLLRSASFLFSKESNPGVQRSSSQKSRSLGVLSSSYKENKDVKQCMKKCTKILAVRHKYVFVTYLFPLADSGCLKESNKRTGISCSQWASVGRKEWCIFIYFFNAQEMFFLCTYKGRLMLMPG